jgi:hypothetical protein
VVELLDPDLVLRAYAIGVFPMSDSRNANEVFLGGAAQARHPADRRLSACRARCARRSARAPSRSLPTPHSRGAPPLLRARGDLDQRHHRGELQQSAPAGPRAFDRMLADGRLVGRALRREARRRLSSARACSRSAPTPRRWHWPGWWQG